jgi:hypothetical protein
MAVRPTQTNEEQRLRMQLQRDKASLETKKGSRSVALNISTDPKETPARRAEFAAKYKKLVGEIKDLESKIDVTSKGINKAKARKSLDVYDEAEGQKQLGSIKEKYALLAEAYKLDKDPDIKAKIETLVDDYRKVSTSVIGRPISLTAARSALTGSAPTFGTPTGKTATSTAPSSTTETPAQTSKITSGGTTGGKTGGSTGEITTGITPITGSGGAIPSTFNVGTFRAADEASMAEVGSTTKTDGTASSTLVKTYDEALLKAQKDFNLPDIIFSNVKSLGDLLDRYVNPKKYGKNGISDINQFIQLVQNDPWFRQNSTEIKARYLQKFNYDDLVKSGQAKGTTDYEQKIAQITNNLIKKARDIGSVLDEGQAKLMAEDLYIFNQDGDDAVVTRRLVSGIRPIAGMIAGRITEDYSGLALKNYQGLQAIAKANGFKIEDILPPGVDGKPATAQDTLKRLTLGEIDPLRLEQDVRKLAAVGQPQFVRDLLGQGINLDVIYAPYKKTMARILELDEGQIDLTDPTLRMGINDKGDVNLFDYSKALRQDSRWQYTGNAREEVSDAALTVLRNFGFQG